MVYVYIYVYTHTKTILMQMECYSTIKKEWDSAIYNKMNGPRDTKKLTEISQTKTGTVMLALTYGIMKE